MDLEFAVDISNTPGGLAWVTGIFGQNEINIEAIMGVGFDHGGVARIVTDNVDRARSVLQAAKRGNTISFYEERETIFLDLIERKGEIARIAGLLFDIEEPISIESLYIVPTDPLSAIVVLCPEIGHEDAAAAEIGPWIAQEHLEFTINLSHKPGALLQVARTLAQADINIITLAATGYDEESAVLRLVTSEPNKARPLLHRLGVLSEREHEAWFITLKQRPNILTETLLILANKGVNLSSLYLAPCKGVDASIVITLSGHQQRSAAFDALLKG